jgi:hypothetical protein
MSDAELNIGGKHQQINRYLCGLVSISSMAKIKSIIEDLGMMRDVIERFSESNELILSAKNNRIYVVPYDAILADVDLFLSKKNTERMDDSPEIPGIFWAKVWEETSHSGEWVRTALKKPDVEFAESVGQLEGMEVAAIHNQNTTEIQDMSFPPQSDAYWDAKPTVEFPNNRVIETDAGEFRELR